MSDLYDRDFHAWTAEQAALLRGGALSAADVEHIAEEIESMARGERNLLTDRLAVLMAHLLKWRHQPRMRSNSWRLTVREQSRQANRLLRQNPSLCCELPAVMADAVLIAARETGLTEDVSPSACPWSYKEATRAILERADSSRDRTIVAGRSLRRACGSRSRCDPSAIAARPAQSVT